MALGSRSTSWIHLSLDYRGAGSPYTPVPFAGVHAFAGASLEPNDSVRNTHNRRVFSSGSGVTPVPPPPPGAIPLRGLDLCQYCRSLGSNYVGYEVVMDPDCGKITAYSLYCKTTNGYAGIDMYQACMWQYKRSDTIDVMQNFNSTTDWKCYSKTGLIGNVTPLDVTGLCNYTQRGTGYQIQANNAYGILCRHSSGQLQGVDMAWLCQWKAGRNNVIDVMRKYNDVLDWNCYGI